MNKNTLLILDLSCNKKVLRKNCFIIRIDKGLIDLKNYNDLTYKFHLNNKNTNEIISIKILSYLKKFKYLFDNNDIYKSEIANYRNDKNDIYDKIKNLLFLKEQKFQNKFDIEIISDKKNSKDIFDQLFKSYKFVDLSKEKKINPFIKFFFSRTKFFIKLIFISLYLKIFTKKRKLKKKIGLSIYPLFIKNSNITLYERKDLTYLNFLLTDETHISKNFFELIEIINIIKKNSHLYIIERDIKIINIIKNYLLSLRLLFQIKKIMKTKIKINSINFSHILNDYMLDSLINLFKLENYKIPLNEIFKKKNHIKEFHYFLFEYNFGFFLIDIIKNNNSSIDTYGYQHGIFDYNNSWLNVISKLSFKNNFLPNAIYCKYRSSIKAYSKKFKVKVYYNKNRHINYELETIQKKINKKSRNSIIYLGLHDGIDILNEILIKKNFMNKYEKIFIKTHPKTKNIKKQFHSNKKFIFIKNLNKVYFRDIYVSPRSSLKYLFEENNLPFKLAKVAYK